MLLMSLIDASDDTYTVNNGSLIDASDVDNAFVSIYLHIYLPSGSSQTNETYYEAKETHYKAKS